MPQKKPINPRIPMISQTNLPVTHGIMAGFYDLLEKFLSIDKIKNIYDAIPQCSDPFEFLEYTLGQLNIRYVLDEEGRRSVPESGPAIVVSNHPFGGIDGMILASALSSVRKDIKVIVNYFLENIKELNPLFFLVDPFNRKDSPFKNMEPIRKAVKWLKTGGMLVILPAGEVSHFSLKSRKVEDPPWNAAVGRLVQMTEAPVLPVYFKGRNSLLFQIAGFAHPRVRTAMLPRETLKKEGLNIEFRIGRLITYKSLSRFRDIPKLTEYLRFRTYLLGAEEENGGSRSHANEHQRRSSKSGPIVPPVNSILLAKEVSHLPSEQKLLTGPEFSVYYGRASQIPLILREIGRLREETFRAVGEGTGNAIDLDRFDNIYTHLFLWNHPKKELVGAYRLGPTLDILPRHGKKGLYTSTLFKYQMRLLVKIGPALELGRTFVAASYQNDYSPLLLLWKGIGQYINRHPYYKTLFGAVSISNDYSPFSRQLMAAFLRLNSFSLDLSKMIRPRRPLGRNRAISLVKEKEDFHRNDLNEISSWISCVEADGKGVPILLKQYLKLGGKVLCFNVDREFGNTLDGLMVVDLTQTEHKVLRRYMGEEGFQRYLAYQHSLTHEAKTVEKNHFFNK